VPATFLTIDPQSSTPPFEQLRSQMIAAVRSGDLPHDTRLPTVRALAAELGLATNTVARAYRELERDNVIETRGRFGSFVAPQGQTAQLNAQAAADAFVTQIQQLGVSASEALSLISDTLKRQSTT